MDRQEWLAERQAAVVSVYDAEAPAYDEHDYPSDVQRKAVRPGGVMYLTVEEARQSKIDQAYESLSARGLPVVRGETVEGDVAGYHYYPGRDQVVQWLAGEGLTIIDEGFKWEDGWGYRHFLLR
jgi:hypothetical protein